MGESKRRKKLGLSPRKPVFLSSDYNKDKLIAWLPISRKYFSKYPYLPVLTMALGLFLLLVDWTKFNTIS